MLNSSGKKGECKKGAYEAMLYELSHRQEIIPFILPLQSVKNDDIYLWHRCRAMTKPTNQFNPLKTMSQFGISGNWTDPYVSNLKTGNDVSL